MTVTSKQDNKGQAAEMTKRWLPVTGEWEEGRGRLKGEEAEEGSIDSVDQGLGQPYIPVRPFRTVCRAKRPSRTPCLFRCQLCIGRPRAVFGFERLQHKVPEWLQPFTEGMVEEDTNPPGRYEKCHPEPLPPQPPLPTRHWGNTISSFIFQKTPNCDA